MEIINSDNFEEKVTNASGVVLVDFFATWCGPCRMLTPVLEEVSEETDAKIYKVDIDKSEDLSREYGIMVVPTMIIFKDGKEQEKFSGYMQKEDILAKLNNFSKNWYCKPFLLVL